MRLLITLTPVSLLSLMLISCGDKEQAEVEKLIDEKSKHHEASDWTPTDPALVNGKAIYKVECSGCHDEGEEGAPKLSSVTQWEERTSKGADKLIENAINGFIGPDGKMPARGGTDSLTDEEVANAVNFMIKTPR